MIIYGTRIQSDIDLPLHFFEEAQSRYELTLSSNLPKALEQSITCGFPFYMAHGRRVYLYSDRLFEGNETGQPWCYEVKDIVRFYWRSGEEKIYYVLDEQGDASLLAFWFVHLLLPLYLTFEQKYDFFHAGAVEVDGKPILFIAPSMGGKSTMTDFFIKQGHALISDDKVPTFIEAGRFMLTGSHPYHRPYRKFEELGYRVEHFMTDTKPIHAFYVLHPSDADADITIEEIKGFEKFDALLPNYLYTFSYLKPVRLNYLSKMLNSVSVFRICVPWDMNRLSEVHQKLCEHALSR